MSPFCRVFKELRTRHGLRQEEVAHAMCCEQTYVSALEVGSKGPPSQEFLEALMDAMSLNDQERAQLDAAAQASTRKFSVSADLPENVYWMLQELRDHLETLHPTQVGLVREILKLRDSLARPPEPEMGRIRRRINRERTLSGVPEVAPRSI